MKALFMHVTLPLLLVLMGFEAAEFLFLWPQHAADLREQEALRNQLGALADRLTLLEKRQAGYRPLPSLNRPVGQRGH